jgi:hypothetical protein
MTPREHDEATAALCFELEKANRHLGNEIENVHHEAGDRRNYRERDRPWGMNLAGALEKTTPLARSCFQQACGEKHRLEKEIAAMDAIYLASPWLRYFPCLNSNGHIHSSQSCSTLRPATRMGWTPQLSGKPVSAAIAELGPILCSVCFPEAPVEWRRDPQELNTEKRTAEKAAREAAKLVKNLAQHEQFRDHFGSRVTTVAGCKKALRDEVELRDYYGKGPHPSHPAAAWAAQRAAEVLLLRGIAQDEIDRIVANAVKKNRKDGARI